MKFFNSVSFTKLSPIFTVWLTGIYPVVILYAHNADQLMLRQLLFAVIVSVAFSTVIFFLWLPLLKNSVKASLATVFFLIIFWNYGIIYTAIGEIGNLKLWHILPLLFFLYFHIVYFITRIRQQKTLNNLNLILLIPLLLLVLINLVTIVPLEYRRMTAVRDQGQIQSKSNMAVAGKNYPDIYLIILDEYASLHTIKEEWGFDNSGFGSFLKDTGFFVAEKSVTRYNQTTWNMPSLMNLEYLTGPVDQETFLKFNYEPDLLKGSEISDVLSKFDFDVRIKKWNNNFLTGYLKNHGYKVIMVEGLSQYYSTFNIWDADSTFSYQDMKESDSYRFLKDAFYIELIKKTIIAPLEIFLTIDQSVNINYTGTKYVVNYLNKVVYPTSGPKFTYAHIMCPHIPYVFDKEGNYILPINENEQRKGAYMPEKNTVNAAYLEQYIYITNEIKNVVKNQIQRKSETSPIIIIQSDHGPRPHEVFLKDKANSFEVFNAVYFPDGDYRILYDSISPINTMRVILNKYFGEAYNMLEDK
jgi:hypothetical protein